MLKPNFKSPAVCADLSTIAIGVVMLFGGMFCVMDNDPFRPLMLLPGTIGLVFFVIGIIALIDTVRREHWVNESIREHNASGTHIQLIASWW